MPRLASFDLLCFPIIDWHFRFQRPQQILSRLAKKGHRIFYLSTRLSGLDAREVQVEAVDEQVLLLSLPGNSRFNIYRHIPSENTIKKGVEALSDFLIDQDCGEVVLLVHLPFWAPYAEALKKRFGWPIIYDCMDEHSGFETNTEAMVSAEGRLIDSADLVVVSSLPLQKKLVSRRPVHLLRNACDYKHFNKLSSREQGPLADLKSPIIGYYGAIAEWFDLQTLERALSARPEWMFVLIGHVSDARVHELNGYPNLKLLGEKPYGELPSYLSGFDVCVIPFKRTPLTEATNPVKVYEYLASGKPVVARRLPELEEFGKDLFLYERPEEFIFQIEQALKEDNASLRRKRQGIAAANRWELRVDAYHDFIKSLYGKTSIIIVSYQGLHYLRLCVESIIRYTRYPNYEVIIVDNGSDSSVVAYLQHFEKSMDCVKVIYNAENRGFAAANNQGLELAKDSDFFVLLNNDTVVTPGWLSRLIFYARQPEIGLVGPVTNFVGNEARIKTHYRDLDEMVRFAKRIYSIRDPEFFDIDVLAMFCVAFRKEMIQKVGLLDERFGIGMFEDDDYAKRVRQAGYRVICAEDVFVHHFGSVSLSRLDEQEYQALFEQNRLKYEEKWGYWKPHRYREGM
jgi:GT2 family glycosyltransferase